MRIVITIEVEGDVVPTAGVERPDNVGVADIIDDLGGNHALTVALGLSPSAVSEMRRRNSIPARHWGAVLRFAQVQRITSVTAERLIRAHDDQRVPA